MIEERLAELSCIANEGAAALQKVKRFGLWFGLVWFGMVWFMVWLIRYLSVLRGPMEFLNSVKGRAKKTVAQIQKLLGSPEDLYVLSDFFPLGDACRLCRRSLWAKKLVNLI